MICLIAVIGYGMTNTGRTVLTGILIGTLGLAAVGLVGGVSAQRRDYGVNPVNTLQYRCRVNPSLPECFRRRKAVLRNRHQKVPYF